jgi:hypothetical protein
LTPPAARDITSMLSRGAIGEKMAQRQAGTLAFGGAEARRSAAMVRKTRFMKWVDSQVAAANLEGKVEECLQAMRMGRRGLARVAAPRDRSPRPRPGANK